MSEQLHTAHYVARIAELVESIEDKDTPSGREWHARLEDFEADATAHHRVDAATRSVLGRLVRQTTERRALGRELYALFSETVSQNGLYRFSDFAEIADLPTQGVYLIFDPSEPTQYSNSLPRIVRVGTHGVSTGSKSILRTRLRAHYGQRNGTGNHRASIFRQHVGNAIINRDHLADEFPSWNIGMSAGAEVRSVEEPLERAVSDYIGSLTFTYLSVQDTSSPQSARAFLERYIINFLTADFIPLEPPSMAWVGRHSPVDTIRLTGLWNIQHSGSKYSRKSFRAFSDVVQNPRLLGV